MAKKLPTTDLRTALELLLDTIEKHGNWEDGCFYYNGTSASELQEPLRVGRLVLAAEGGSYVLPCSVRVENTTIAKGCKLSMLLIALALREGR